MKKSTIVILILALLLPIGALSEGYLQTKKLPLAAPYDLPSIFHQYPGYSEKDGKWEFIAHETCAMFQYIENAENSTSTLSGFYFSLYGEKDTGLIIPFLNIFYRNASAKLEPQAVSFLIDGTRFDFVGTAQEMLVGNVSLERMSIPLDLAGLSFWHSICAQNDIQIQLYGKKTYATSMQMAEVPKTALQYLGNACFTGSATLLAIINSVFPMSSYLLWDMNAIACEAQFSTQPCIRSTNLAWALDSEPFASSPMGVLSIGTNGKNVSIFQERLVERGFLIGPRDNSYGIQTRKAVELAQVYYNLPCTGFAERTLYECLQGTTQAQELVMDSPDAGIGISKASSQLALKRYWFASAAKSSHAESELGIYSCDNDDEILLIIDGKVVNNGGGIITSAEYDAHIMVDEMEFPARILFEVNRGSLLHESLQPMTGTRIIFVAQIPKSLVCRDSITLHIRGTNNEVEIALIGQ